MIDLSFAVNKVLSANNLMLKFDTKNKSFIYSKNKSGPNVDPCSTQLLR